MRWRRVARRLYRTLLPACLRRRIALLLAFRLPGLRGLGVGTCAWLAIKDFFVDDMATYAAAVAFHLFLALFPFVIFLVALLSFLHLPGFFDWLLSQAGVALPASMWGQVAQAVRQVSTHVRGGLLSAGIIASRYGLSIAYTLGFTALVIGATAVLLSGPAALAALAAHVGLDRAVVAVWGWLRVPVALLVLMLAVALVYYVAPNTEQPFQLLTPGAVLAVLGWLSASLLFSAYVATVAHYNTKYGNIAAIVVLLLYFYISSLALLLGAEVNAVILHYAPREQGSARARAAQPRRAGRKPVA
jgi:membrane protein